MRIGGCGREPNRPNGFGRFPTLTKILPCDPSRATEAKDGSRVEAYGGLRSAYGSVSLEGGASEPKDSVGLVASSSTILSDSQRDVNCLWCLCRCRRPGGVGCRCNHHFIPHPGKLRHFVSSQLEQRPSRARTLDSLDHIHIHNLIHHAYVWSCVWDSHVTRLHANLRSSSDLTEKDDVRLHVAMINTSAMPSPKH